jgi:16S rRNA (guanine527-N7)-methyltransferase
MGGVAVLVAVAPASVKGARRAVNTSGLPIDEQKGRLLERYLDLVYADPNRLNLTRVERQDAWTRHVQESLDLLPMRTWSPGERVIDLGSGAGFPGIPLAIALPRLVLVLIERDRAKAAFLLSTLGRLDLPAVQVLAGDASELIRRPDFEPADVLVSRATLPVPKLLNLAAYLLRAGGEGLVHVGKSVAVDEDLHRVADRSAIGNLELVRSGRSRFLRFSRQPDR